MTARQLALTVLFEIDKNGAYVGIELKKQLYACELSHIDKAFATELVYGVIKNRTRLDYVISKFSKQKLKKISVWILNILRLGIYQILFLDKIPESAAVNESVKLAKRYGHQASSGFVNGVLRSVIRNGDVEYPKGKEYFEIFYSHPKWLVDMLFAQYGEEATKIIEANNTVPSTTVRINTLKTDVKILWDKLTSKGICVSKTLEENIIKISGFGDISKLEEYINGEITPQGLSSYLASKLLDVKENDVVMDLCSAPGGKSTAMAEYTDDNAKIFAFDIYDHKVEIINKNCKRLGIINIKTKVWDSTKLLDEFVGKADKILVDAPCSGIGIIRKKPDIKWNRENENFEDLISIQKSILENADKYLKKDGTLVYSTCTLNKAENEDVTKEFAKEYNYEIVLSKTILPYDDMDGFYMCKMIKR